MEAFRPAHCLPRAQSVFLVDDPDTDNIEKAGGYADYVFRVEPVGEVERNDVGWWAEIYGGGAFEYADGDTGVLEDLKPAADAYWAGAASRSPRWEFRAREAVVLECAGGYRVQAPRGPL